MCVLSGRSDQPADAWPSITAGDGRQGVVKVVPAPGTLVDPQGVSITRVLTAQRCINIRGALEVNLIGSLSLTPTTPGGGTLSWGDRGSFGDARGQNFFICLQSGAGGIW